MVFDFIELKKINPAALVHNYIEFWVKKLKYLVF
jgi:hypothetical protein